MSETPATVPREAREDLIDAMLAISLLSRRIAQTLSSIGTNTTTTTEGENENVEDERNGNGAFRIVRRTA